MRKVEVIDYQEAWKEKYHSEATLLRTTIGFLNPDVHHIGSTSVPGLSAKPIIDILIEVENLDDLDENSKCLEAIGYIGLGENGIPGRRYFEKGGDDRTHQIHAFEKGSIGSLRHLAFRDYLMSHPQVAHEYAILKKHVASVCNNDIDRYCEGKNQFVKKYEKLAINWYSHNKRMQSDVAKPHR